MARTVDAVPNNPRKTIPDDARLGDLDAGDLAETVQRYLFGNGVLRRWRPDGGTSRRHPFKIFEFAVFRVALRIGTKLEGAMWRGNVNAAVSEIAFGPHAMRPTAP
jgi:hypothetical protein